MGTFVHNYNLVFQNSLITKKPRSSDCSLHQVSVIRPLNNSITLRITSIMSQNAECLLYPRENFSNIGGLPTSPAALFKIDVMNSLTVTLNGQQKITLQNKYSEKLVGLLHDTGSTDIVVLCHGFRSSKETNTSVNLAIALENKGISSFRFDFAGNGESEGSFQYGHYRREVEDLRAVVEYFIGANRRVASILGHSKGGNIVLLYASKYHDICTVVNVSGRYKLDRGIEERLGKDFLEIIKKDGHIDVKNRAGEVQYRVTEESMMDRLNTNMHEACLLIDKNCRVLTVHGSEDEIIPLEDALEFAKIIPNHKLHIIEGADHGYTSHQAGLTSAVLPFIKDGLQQSKSS